MFDDAGCMVYAMAEAMGARWKTPRKRIEKLGATMAEMDELVSTSKDPIRDMVRQVFSLPLKELPEIVESLSCFALLYRDAWHGDQDANEILNFIENKDNGKDTVN
jgi:hypothetical protein